MGLLGMDALELLGTTAMCLSYLELQSLHLASGLRAQDRARFAVGRPRMQPWVAGLGGTAVAMR